MAGALLWIKPQGSKRQQCGDHALWRHISHVHVRQLLRRNASCRVVDQYQVVLLQEIIAKSQGAIGWVYNVGWLYFLLVLFSTFELDLHHIVNTQSSLSASCHTRIIQNHLNVTNNHENRLRLEQGFLKFASIPRRGNEIGCRGYSTVLGSEIQIRTQVLFLRTWMWCSFWIFLFLHYSSWKGVSTLTKIWLWGHRR